MWLYFLDFDEKKIFFVNLIVKLKLEALQLSVASF